MRPMDNLLIISQFVMSILMEVYHRQFMLLLNMERQLSLTTLLPSIKLISKHQIMRAEVLFIGMTKSYNLGYIVLDMHNVVF